MKNPDFDVRVLDEFLELGGEDMRQALLAQVCNDLTRCHEALGPDTGAAGSAPNMVALCRTAHEIKGIAATIGAVPLTELARTTETACSGKDQTALHSLLPDLRQQTIVTIQSLAELARA